MTDLNRQEDTTFVDLAAPADLPSHVRWEDHINLDFSNLSPNYSDEEIAEVALRVTNVLTDFEASEIGQFHLSRLQEKFGDDPLNLRVHDKTNDGYKGDNVDVSVNPGWGFVDQTSQTFMPMQIERMFIHEIIHAADPNMPREPFAYNDDLITINEEYATLQTDEFARLHRPDLGVRGAYANAIDTSEDIDRNYTDTIAEQVETVDQRVEDARENWFNPTPKM